MSQVLCAFCCSPVKKNPVQCQKCKGVLHCYYCSPKCRTADKSRHKDECYPAVQIEGVDDMLKAWAASTGPADTAAVYRCSAEDGGPGFEVRRKLPCSKEG